ncbi:unnamed protein product, partial [Meganyctiphanes norvegica]
MRLSGAVVVSLVIMMLTWTSECKPQENVRRCSNCLLAKHLAKQQHERTSADDTRIIILLPILFSEINIHKNDRDKTNYETLLDMEIKIIIAKSKLSNCLSYKQIAYPLPDRGSSSRPSFPFSLGTQRMPTQALEDRACPAVEREVSLTMCCCQVIRKIRNLYEFQPVLRHYDRIGSMFSQISPYDGKAQLGEFPWMVALLDKADNYIGGASLVHPRVVLTVAHRVHDKVANNLVARIGDWDLSTTDEPIAHQNIDVATTLLHPTFDLPKYENDVALIILQRDEILSDTVMPVCLPQPDTNFDQSSCIVTGWGKDVFGEAGKYAKYYCIISILKEVSIPAVSHGECQRMLQSTRLGSSFTLDNSFNCAGGNGEDSCTGDGGSPLVCPNPNNPNEYVQMGVVAWGIGCGVVGNPRVYGSVPQTVDWIRK